MTIIQIITKPSGIKVHMEGHSGYGSAGNDIVCACLSTASIYLVEVMRGLGGYYSVSLVEQEREARKDIILPRTAKGHPALETFIEIIKSLEKQYPDHVRVIC